MNLRECLRGITHAPGRDQDKSVGIAVARALPIDVAGRFVPARPFTRWAAEATLAMSRRLTTLIFILALFASTAAGALLHSGGHDCHMAGMEGMDCCDKAQMQENTPEVLAARLCCAFQCPEPGSTAPASQETLRGPQVSPLVIRPAATASVVSYAPLVFLQATAGPTSSPPVYISHHSLLI